MTVLVHSIVLWLKYKYKTRQNYSQIKNFMAKNGFCFVRAPFRVGEGGGGGGGKYRILATHSFLRWAYNFISPKTENVMTTNFDR